MSFELKSLSKASLKLDPDMGKKIADKFRKNQISKSEDNASDTPSLKVQKVHWWLVVSLGLLVTGFLIGWFSSRSHHTPPSELEEEDDGVQILGPEGGLPCKVEGATQPHPHSCSLFMVCTQGSFVVEKCNVFHHFDEVTGSCQWIHLARCGPDQAPPVEPAGPEVPPVVPAPPATIPPTPPTVEVPSLKQVLDNEVELIMLHKASRARKNMRTLSNEEVAAIAPGRAQNPGNVRTVERLLTASQWEFLFPLRNKAYTYRSFLQSVGKFPVFCSSSQTCPLVLATIFAHIAQETGAHDPSQAVPDWRQGLYHVEEVGCEDRDCGYSSNCRQEDTWLTKAWPCGKGEDGQVVSYHGRGAKQISYNYNYGQFSTFVEGESSALLNHPELVASTWLALASAVWFFVMPQPPKPSMLDVVEGNWQPNAADKELGLYAGFGVTTNIINGGIECGKGKEKETQQSKNRQAYFREFASYLGLKNISGETNCGGQGRFSDKGAGALALYWEQDWAKRYRCKLVTYQTAFSALVPGDYKKCVEDKFDVII